MTFLGCPFRAIGRLTKSIHGGEKHAIADPETSTPNGCTCNSLCGATIEDGFTRVGVFRVSKVTRMNVNSFQDRENVNPCQAMGKNRPRMSKHNLFNNRKFKANASNFGQN